MQEIVVAALAIPSAIEKALIGDWSVPLASWPRPCWSSVADCSWVRSAGWRYSIFRTGETATFAWGRTGRNRV